MMPWFMVLGVGLVGVVAIIAILVSARQAWQSWKKLTCHRRDICAGVPD